MLKKKIIKQFLNVEYENFFFLIPNTALDIKNERFSCHYIILVTAYRL